MPGVFPSAALCSLSLTLMSHSSGAAHSVTLAALLTAHRFTPTVDTCASYNLQVISLQL